MEDCVPNWRGQRSDYCSSKELHVSFQNSLEKSSSNSLIVNSTSFTFWEIFTNRIFYRNDPFNLFDNADGYI